MAPSSLDLSVTESCCLLLYMSTVRVLCIAEVGGASLSQAEVGGVCRHATGLPQPHPDKATPRARLL